MKDGLGSDCNKLLRAKINGKIDFEGYLSELELLNHKYPGIGFDKSITDLKAWKSMKNNLTNTQNRTTE